MIVLLDQNICSPISFGYVFFRLLFIFGIPDRIQGKIPIKMFDKRENHFHHQHQLIENRQKPCNTSALVYFHLSRFSSRQEPFNIIKLPEFDQAFLQHYMDPTAPNVILLLLIAETPTDPCIVHFNRQINLIKE